MFASLSIGSGKSKSLGFGTTTVGYTTLGTTLGFVTSLSG